jgi:hypothetical protein
MAPLARVETKLWVATYRQEDLMSRITKFFAVFALSLAIIFATAPSALAGKPDKPPKEEHASQSNPDSNGSGPEREDEADQVDDTDQERNGHENNGSGNKLDGDCDDNEGRGCVKRNEPTPGTPEPTIVVTPESTPTPEATPEVTPEVTVTPTPISTVEITPTPEIITTTTAITVPVPVTTTLVVTVPQIVEYTQTCTACCQPCGCPAIGGGSDAATVIVRNEIDLMPVALAIIVAGGLVALAVVVRRK